MIKFDEYKEQRLKELRDRLKEINNIVGLPAVDGLVHRTDEFGEKMKDRKIEVMKQYYEEMVSIKKEIAKLEGRKSIFEELD